MTMEALDALTNLLNRKDDGETEPLLGYGEDEVGLSGLPLPNPEPSDAEVFLTLLSAGPKNGDDTDSAIAMPSFGNLDADTDQPSVDGASNGKMQLAANDWPQRFMQTFTQTPGAQPLPPMPFGSGSSGAVSDTDQQSADPVTPSESYAHGLMKDGNGIAQDYGHALPAGTPMFSIPAGPYGDLPGPTLGELEQINRQEENDYQARRAAAGQTGFDWAEKAGEETPWLLFDGANSLLGGGAVGSTLIDPHRRHQRRSATCHRPQCEFCER